MVKCQCNVRMRHSDVDSINNLASASAGLLQQQKKFKRLLIGWSVPDVTSRMLKGDRSLVKEQRNERR